MKLDQFITQTLISIISGVKNANKEAHTKDLSPYTRGTFDIRNFGEKQNDAQYINFDVAVSTSSEMSGNAKGSGEIFVASLEANMEGKISSENYSRIKFKILCKQIS